MRFRYFITDNLNIGSLIEGEYNAKKMLLLLGHIIKTYDNTLSYLEIVNIITSKYDFILIKENLEFITLNISIETPYTFFHIIDDGFMDEDGYLYANINEISEYFSNSETTKMLKSITYFNSEKLLT